MKVRTKLIIGFSAVVVLLWLIVFSAANNMGGLKEHFLAVESDIIPNTLEINEIEKAADEAYQLTMDYVLHDIPEAKESSRTKIDELEQLSQEYLPQAEQIGPDEYSDNQELLVKIDTLILNLTYTLNLKELGTSRSELLAFDRNTSLPAFLGLEQFINEKQADSIVQLSAIGEDYKQAHSIGILWLLVSAGFITIIGIAAAYLTTRSIVRPLHALHKGTDMIAQGKLDYKVGTKSEDEIGQLSRAFDQITTNLDKSMTSIDVLNAEITEHKKLQEGLAKEATWRRIMIEQSRDGIVILDQSGKVYEANLQFGELLGYSPEEVVQLYVWDWDTQWTPDELLEMIRNVDEDGDHFETYWERKDGTNVDVEISTNGAIFGEQKLVLCVCRDTTERKLAEKALRESQEFTTSLLENTPTQIIVFNPDTSIRYVNPKFEEANGWTADEIIGIKAPYPWWTDELRTEEMIDTFKESLNMDMGHEEAIARKKNGELYWLDLNWTAVKHDGELQYCLANSADITERKNMAEALRIREERFSDIAENTFEWIWEIDIKGKYTYSSPVVEKILGYKPEEILKKHFYDLFYPEDKQELKKAAFKAFEQKQPFQGFINRNVHKNGKVVYLSTSGVPILDAEENLLGYRGVDTDITEQQKREHLQQDENYVLTLLGQGAELGELLDAIIHLGEDHNPAIKGSILLFDPVKQWLNQASGPSLPEEYLQLMEGGIPIGPVMGSCGTAAYRKERVVIPDIANNPLFESAEEVVNTTKRNNMLACWSQPILSSNAELMGTIANYSNKVGNPDPDDIRILEWSAHIAAIAIERKQAEENLQESEDKFSKAFRSSPNTIAITTIKEGRFIEVNDSFTDLTGYTREEVIGNTAENLNIWAQIKDRDKMLRILKKDGRVNSHEFNFRIKSGEIRTWTFSAELIDIGSEPCMISMTIDITELKQAEQTIKDSEDKFSKAFHSSPAAISIASLKDGSILEVNDSYTRMTGYNREELIGHTTSKFNIWVNAEQKEKMLNKIRNREKMSNEEYKFRIKSGDIHTVLVSSEYLTLSGEPCVLVTNTDITGRKQAEEALRMNEERFRLIADNATDLISRIQMTPTIKTDYVSPSCLRITGYKQEDFYNDPNLGLEMIHPEDREFFLKHTTSDNNKNQKPIIVRLVRKDGQVIWIEQTHTAILNDQGETVAMHLIARDITERKHSEEQLKHALVNLEHSSDQLAATNKELETFSYSVSHDLRSPLRSIDGFSQALLEDYTESLDDTGRDYLNRLRIASQKMGELIDGLLKLSRLTRSEMHQKEVDLSMLAKEITSRLHENDPKRQAEFVIRKGLVTQGDPELLRALFENLIGNAWKFTSKSKKARIEFGTTKNGNKTTYYINDNGAGFDMTYADKLFGAFQRLHDTSEYPGTGIGLATVLRIINRHGGNIWAEGAVNKGATFYFTLN